MYDSDAGRGRGSAGRRGRIPAVVAVAVGAALLISGCSGSSGDDGSKNAEDREQGAVKQQPKGTDPYWVNPQGNAAKQVASYEKSGKDSAAAQIRKIAEQPVGEWLSPDNPEQQARGFTEAAEKADRSALLVLYNVPHRDCGQYSGGGAADGNAYRAWIDQVAKGIGGRPATVILEPDALLHLVDGCTPEQFHEERFDLLKGAIEKLKGLSRTKVYLDAGNAGWQEPEALRQPLTRVGVSEADGFAVNVSNFQPTDVSTEFGKKLSEKIGGKPFVIDTSRNGNGPYTGGDAKERWCNPPGRALGEAPSTRTTDSLVDAYLWVKRPGESDGTCKGGPKAGDWWPEYALKLARASG
ncbi:glycoside hydrolase family 6 protein [Streptomyces tsukubensis]|uniref:Glucanase n=1 Tax=Streptomyces tsukubensis TaxID=83656 RepID=A0A1V4A5Y9_9ACTN|nr:glycoside hydrolase family 6 protein [Streptomyces tsukubensis]OON76976.1 endoglucanase [Streptomyces tsukubensis]QFR93786.1 endoglucanase [Streptomyces tsukubensis]